MTQLYKKSLIILGLITTALTTVPAFALTPNEYCKSIPTITCEVLNVEALTINFTTAVAEAGNKYSFGQKVPLDGNIVLSGKVEFKASSGGGNISGVSGISVGPKSFSFKSCSGKCCAAPNNVRQDEPVKLVESAFNSVISGYSSSCPSNGLRIDATSGTCVHPDGCLIKLAESTGSVPLMKKVCQNGKFEVIIKNQPLSLKSSRIKNDDCTD